MTWPATDRRIAPFGSMVMTTDAPVTRRRDALEEKERILAAAVREMTRTAPAAPTVSEIIAAAGTGIVAEHLAAQMAQQADPADKIACWVSGLLGQLSDPRLFSMCYSTLAQMSAVATRRASDDLVMAPLRILLTTPIVALHRPYPQRDSDAVFHCTMGTLRRYLGSSELPPAEDVDHLVRFCLNGIGVRVGETHSV